MQGILVQTEKQFDAALDVLRKASVIAVDTETYGKKGEHVRHPAQGNRLIGFSTHCILPGNSDYAVSFYFPFRHQMEDGVMNLFTLSENLPIELLPKFAEVLNRNDVLLIFHHLKFDGQIFRADDLWITPNPGTVQDVLPKAQLVDEMMSHRLKDLGEMIFGADVKIDEKALEAVIRKQGGYHKTTPQQMAPYACTDARLTHDVNPYIDRELQRQGLSHLVPREMEFQLCLMEMEWEGINFDRVLAEELSKRSRLRMRQLEDDLGFDPQKKNPLANALYANKKGPVVTRTVQKHQVAEQVNFMQLSTNGEVELTKTKTAEWPHGIPKMAEQTLVELRDPVADMVLEYRGLQKANSTWYNGWIKRVGDDGRIHPTYNHSDKKAKFGTVTSRLSSFIQQMPRDPEAMVKMLLKPDNPESVLIEMDYAQIEYREAACYAKDDDLIQQFRENADPHQILADQIGVDRQSAKQTVYTILYDGQKKALALNLMKQVWLNEKKIVVITEDEADDIIQRYYKVHPKIKKVSAAARTHAKKYGYVTLWNGRRRHFYASEPWTFRKAFNSILQGGAAQIIEETMLRFHRMREDVPFRMRAQIHDSLLMNVPLDRFDDHVELARETMEWPGQHFDVPFPVDWKIIRGWELEDKNRGTLLGARSGADDGLGAL